MSNVRHPGSAGDDHLLLAQVLKMLDRLHQPDGRLASWDLPGRLQKAHMHGVCALINSASRKLRDARLLSAAPCEQQLLDAVLDALVGAYFLDCLTTQSTPADMPPITATHQTAAQSAPPAAWSNQNYYRFMEEVASRRASANLPGDDAPGASTIHLRSNGPETNPSLRHSPPDSITETMPPSAARAPLPGHQPGAPRPYSRVARLRQDASRLDTSRPLTPKPAENASSTVSLAPHANPATAPTRETARAELPSASPAGRDKAPADQQAHYRREAESQAWADYLAQAGKAIYAATVLTPTGAVTLARPMLFTVIAGAQPDAVCQWRGNRLQPVWRVRPVGAQPETLKQQARLWIYGHEYDDEGRFFASGYFSPALPAAPAQVSAADPPPAPAAASAPRARAAIEAQAVRAYEANLGRVLEVQELCGYVEALGDEVIHCVPPATVRVVKTSPDYLLQWRNNELWSQWQVEAVTPRSDLARAKQLRIPGPAWRATGEQIGVSPAQPPH